jgi:hypothetical protein
MQSFPSFLSPSLTLQLFCRLPKFTSEKRRPGDSIELTNAHIDLKFDGTKGTLSRIKLKKSSTQWDLNVEFATYGSK